MREEGKVFVIAECGSCHDNDIVNAKALINVAKGCGADAAKFQYWSSGERLADRRNAGAYREVYDRYQIPVWWLSELKTYCDSLDIEFMCTAYLPEDVDTVAPCVQHFKVASFEAEDEELMERIIEYNDRGVIVSLGMGAELMGDYDTMRSVETLLCVSAYPAPDDQLHLARLLNDHYSRTQFNGYSDHSYPTRTLTGALAVAAGAMVIERHIRLAETSPLNPDVATAMLPEFFDSYVQFIRMAEVMMGDGAVSGPLGCEREMAKYRVVP